ncbi:MAG: metallophosphoesterase family protein [Actinomycetota bacterium]
MGSLYVVSDVHGHRDDFLRGLDRLGFGADDELWILGDLLDRGPDGFGVVEAVMRLQREAPGRVHVLMGNHEILAVGRYRFPGSQFSASWRANGGRVEDQARLREEHIAWLASLPVLGGARSYVLMHSDTTAITTWGGSVEEVNETVRDLLSDPDDLEAHWQVWALLTRRYEFAGGDGREVARPAHQVRRPADRARPHDHRLVARRAVVTGHAATAVRRRAGARHRRRPLRRRAAVVRRARLTRSGRPDAAASDPSDAADRTGQTRRRTAVTLPRMVAWVPSIGS